MEFHYQNALLPNDRQLLRDINKAASRLSRKLSDIDINKLREILSNEGFEVDIIPGFYANSRTNRLLKRFMGIVLNPLISMLKERGLIFAPFYTICAGKTES